MSYILRLDKWAIIINRNSYRRFSSYHKNGISEKGKEEKQIMYAKFLGRRYYRTKMDGVG